MKDDKVTNKEIVELLKLIYKTWTLKQGKTNFQNSYIDVFDYLEEKCSTREKYDWYYKHIKEDYDMLIKGE